MPDPLVLQVPPQSHPIERRNIASLQDWGESVIFQRTIGIEFTDSNIGAPVTNQQLRRLLSDGGGTNVMGKTVRWTTPFALALEGMSVDSDTAVTAGQLTAFIRIGGVVVAAWAAGVVWGAGKGAYQTFDPNVDSIAAGSALDIAVTTTGPFNATGADVIVGAYFRRLS